MATPCPVTPAQIKATISDPTSSICGNLKNTLLKFPLLMYQFINWALDADGNLTNNFISLMQKPGDLILSAAPLAADETRLLCNGATVSRTTYAALFTAIGETYGAGDGSTTFVLPDYRDKFPVGAGNSYTLATGGGAATVTLDLTQIPAHTHAVEHARATASSPSADAAGGLLGAGAGGDISYNTTSKGGGLAHTNLPPYMPAYIYVKT